MRKSVIIVMITMMTMILELSQCCLESEKIGLLEIKDKLPFYLEYNLDSDCCSWEGVECNSSTGHVTRLDFSYMYTVSEWYLNASLFLPFPHLYDLDLGHNGIAGCIQNEGFERLSSTLTNLEILDLSGNHFNNSILQSLAGLRSLKSLYLGSNKLNGTVNNRISGFESLSTLTNLEILDLSDNNLNNSILQSLSGLHSLKSLYLHGNNLNETITNRISGFESLSTLTNLEILDLSYNNLNNSILQSLGAFRSLKSLYLRGNRLNGISGFERLSSTLNNLEILSLSENNLNNSTRILQSLGGFPSLKSLYLRSNGLSGTFNISDLDGLPNLQELSLSENEITEFVVSKDYRGPSNLSTLYLNSMRADEGISSLNLQSLAKLPKIKTLSLTDNIFQGQTLPEEPLYDYKSKVEEIWLDYSSIDEKFLGSLSRAFPSLKLLSMTHTSGTLAVGEGSTFGSLEHLYLNDSTLDNKWLQRIGTMRSLKTLSMPRCGLNGNIPAFQGLCQLKHLQELDLSSNDLTGNLPWCLGNWTSLERIDLSYNQLSGNIPAFQGLCQLKHLQELDLSNNNLTGNPSSCLGNMTSLLTLDLSYNQLSGNIPAFQGLCQLKHLQELDLSNNDLTGNPSWCLGNITSLQTLDLSYNLLQIPNSLTPLFNLSQLTSLYVSTNTIYADTHDHNLKPKFQLEDLKLSGYSDGTEIPKFLYHQRNLQSVGISNNKMRGMFPYWLLENNTRLRTLDLSNNSLSGPLLLPNKPHLNLKFLDISDNNFNGSIPSQVGEYFPNLIELYMSRNELKGSIPDSLCKNAYFFSLDMSQNNISGTIPKCIGNMINLNVLNLSNNSISGCLTNFGTSLMVVKLSKNRLQGSWNKAFYNCIYLLVLDLSHNNFSGSVPSWIGRLSQLNYLVLEHNNFQGEIPVGLCKLKQLSFLDISHNKISSHMISCLNLISKSFVSIGITRISVTLDFTVKRNTYSYKLISSYMCGIDVSSNNLRGPIPPQIGDLGNIKVLNFSHNGLTGRIPPTFSNLKEIESLDLSYNDLQGTIPHQLTQLTGLAVFNVSYNNLSGPTPDNVKQFATFDESSYKGNPFLCGWPLTKSCIDSPPSSAYGEESNDSLIDMEAFYWSFGIAYGMVLMSIVAVLCINPHWRRVWFYYVQISIDNSYYFLIDNVPFLSRFKFPRFCRRIYRCIRD